METLLLRRAKKRGLAGDRADPRALRILYHHRTKSRDGQFVHIQSLIRAFRRAGHQVDEVGLTAGSEGSMGQDSPFWSAFTKLTPSPIMELLEYAYSFPAALWLRSRIRRNPPDLLYERYACGNFAGVLASRWCKVPLILEVNSPLAQEKRTTGDLFFCSLAKATERLILKGATRIIVVSEALKEIYLNEGIDAEKIEVIPNGIDLEHYENRRGDAFRHRHGLEGFTVIGFVGFLREWHRLDLLLEILARELGDLNVKVVFVGDGPVRPKLEALQEKLGIASKVVWAGTLDHEEVPDALAAFDIALQSEVTPYASPLKLFEYMAAQRAIAAPRRPNIEEIVKDGESALLFEPGDREEMSHALRRLVFLPELRRRLGTAARERLLRRGYTWDANAKRVASMVEMD